MTKDFGLERNAKVSARAYAAAMLAQSTEETRYYLNGVLIEPSPAGGVNVVATNGHIIIAVHDKDGETNGRWICPVPPQMRAFLLKHTEPAPEPEDHDGLSDEDVADPRMQLRRIEFVGHMASIIAPEFAWKDRSPEEIAMAATAQPIDGNFPDWHRVVPRPTESTPPLTCYTVAHRYVSELARAVRIWQDGNHAGIRLRGVEKAGPVLASAYGDTDIIMALMPMRDDAPPLTLPDWVPASVPSDA